MGGDAVRGFVPKFLAGDYLPIKQDDAQHTLAPLLSKESGRVDWSSSARRVHNHVRGMSPWPGAFTTLRDKTVKLHATRLSPVVAPANTAPGTVIVADKTGVVVACGGGTSVELECVQLEGKKAVRATEWVNGRGVAERDVLGDEKAR
jgi:methionyl-tRNA formyltransferase